MTVGEHYEDMWERLKLELQKKIKNAHNPMSSMSEGVWTESVCEDILKTMDKLENEEV